MVKLSAGHVLTGAVLGSVGAALFVAGLLRAGFVDVMIFTVPGSTLAMTVGGVMLAGAGLVLAASIRPDLGPEPSVPAHLAFISKPIAHEVEPPELVHPKRRVEAHGTLPPEVLKLDTRIRDITREINKAGVMLATGKLSREAFVQYVDDLKKQRGDLEATKIDLELHRSTKSTH